MAVPELSTPDPPSATTADRPLSGRARRRRGKPIANGLASLALLTPPVGWVAGFFLVPAVFLFLYSVGVLALLPGGHDFSLTPWREVIGRPIYVSLLWKSVRIALISSTLCVLLAYPLAYTLALTTSKRRYPLLLLLLAPFMTSFLLRIFAWKILLGDNGALNSLFYWAHLRAAGEPVAALLYSQVTVVIVLVFGWAPFVALPIFVSLENLDTRVLEAAMDLGASRRRAFFTVTLPLSAPGVVAGFIFVFVPTLGEFLTPLLVGGRNGYMIGNAIRDLFGASLDWQTGAILALLLMVLVTVLLLAFSRILRVNRLATDSTA